MDVQQINVTIDANGQVQIEISGVKGKACLDITAALEQALGGNVILREMTSDAFIDPTGQVEIPPPLKNQT
jgi:hypothetical protein